MAQIALNIPDAALPRVADAIAVLRGYNAALDGTKTQFAKKHLIAYLKQMVLEYEGRIAADAATLTKRTEIDGIDIT